jgi:hypothetical protein
MKTLINKNKIRLAGGLMVLLMTAILAVTTAKSYAWEWYGGTCWHMGSTKTPIIPYTWFSCCSSCSAQIPWDVSFGPEPGYTYSCVSGPDSNGYGYASCQILSADETVQTGYTWYIGGCPSACPALCNMTSKFYVTGTTTIPKGYAVLSGNLTCQPEN